MSSFSIHCVDHKHGPECGHDSIKHGDHFDYLVNRKFINPSDYYYQCFSSDGIQQNNSDNLEDRGDNSYSNKESYQIKSDGLRRRLHQNELSDNSQAAKSVVFYKNRDSLRFILMFILTGGFFFVELIWGIKATSLALIADALHMLTDFIALCIGFYALQIANKSRNDEATFGYPRMEIIGGLMNGCFLMAISITIALESLQKLIMRPDDTELKDNATILLIVASVGLAVNFLGLCIFGFGHGHGHSHGQTESDAREISMSLSIPKRLDINQSQNKDLNQQNATEFKKSLLLSKSQNYNIIAVFLHVFGDALGSVAVIVSASIIAFTQLPNRTLSDPLSSLIISVIIFITAYPVVKGTVEVLLQKVPGQINLRKLEDELLRVDGVIEIHDFHV